MNDDTTESTRQQPTVAPSEASSSNTSTFASTTFAPISYGLGEELIADGARRLMVVAGALGAVVALAAVGQYLAGPDGWGRPGHTIAAVLVVLSLAVMAIARSGRLEGRLILDLALLYQIAVSLGVSMTDNLVDWPEAGFVRGVSWVCVWIVLFPLLVPNTPGKAWLAALVSAAMGPLAYLIAVAGGATAAPWVTIASLYAPNFASVVLAGVAASLVYSMASEVQEAQMMGNYSLVERIGRGGMGEVWSARHRRIERWAAVKIVRPELVTQGDRQALRRFEREAQLTARLRSPHTVELYDFGVTPDRTLFYVMEFLDGIDLDRLVKEFGPLPPGRVVHLLSQALRSLEEAHHVGLVHRDVKPANLVVCRLGGEYDFVKVLDFGLAKAAWASDDGQHTLTGEAVIGGTPAFMAPEMIDKQEIGPHTDIYAIGCVAYFLLTGAPPFSAGAMVGVLMAHMNEVPESPSKRLGKTIPNDLETLVLECLEKKPRDRPSDSTELRRRLAACTSVEPWTPEQAIAWWGVNG